MFSKVKDWLLNLFKKDSLATAAWTKKALSPADLAPKEKSSFYPSELIVKLTKKWEQRKCDHSYEVQKQVWVRIADKKYELQNEVLCRRCSGSKIQPI